MVIVPYAGDSDRSTCLEKCRKHTTIKAHSCSLFYVFIEISSNHRLDRGQEAALLQVSALSRAFAFEYVTCHISTTSYMCLPLVFFCGRHIDPAGSLAAERTG
jgi:hypothetical protein